MGPFLDLSGSWFLHLYNGNNHSLYLIGLLGGSGTQGGDVHGVLTWRKRAIGKSPGLRGWPEQVGMQRPKPLGLGRNAFKTARLWSTSALCWPRVQITPTDPTPELGAAGLSRRVQTHFLHVPPAQLCLNTLLRPLGLSPRRPRPCYEIWLIASERVSQWHWAQTAPSSQGWEPGITRLQNSSRKKLKSGFLCEFPDLEEYATDSRFLQILKGLREHD